ncbi:hypothetical protein, partial [Hyphomonas chukchiensis]|uniref:hypothetical protein n=1 Tax=Hyphomonas chukchiensis TaxID=1280947 RepID=UPI0019D6EBF1
PAKSGISRSRIYSRYSKKKARSFFLFSSPICGPASETQGRLQRRPGNTPHGRKPQPLKTAFQQKSAGFVADGSVLR